ncbi:MAG: GNAT family N-acetyltransferase [Henriciella sp.]|uniref:GNAT family N-acetyltransferase n=1 Tax=Henriciella sp. TaxID=1968823 RepID=UPI000C1144D3|nr:GNAT family N-acetyltransferase [Henriciella sp.]MAN72983.1 GNAT family N-acetyltransferase [Henriciella sp.]MBF34654.1 GNAT family N-acetyltransferase [Hyphomonadaceae bacterium]MBK76724.1 GNAT family N-acetyltransferase [Henriciella sp.]PHR77842.1 MAG: GNAT family N-acetyltransferase [Henriciella sp.]
MTDRFTHRIATLDDIPAIMDLMAASIEHNMREFLSDDEIAAARESMGVDKTLINDQTYFVIETEAGGTTVMVACGGWGKRRTLFGGDTTSGRDDSLADPAIHAARIRAMYTHPEWIRKGLGTLLLELGENAAREAGFRTIELGSTVPGEPLYKVRGYTAFHREVRTGANGLPNTIIHMRKSLV